MPTRIRAFAGSLAILVAVAACATAQSTVETGRDAETLAPGAIVLPDFSPQLAYIDGIGLTISDHLADYAALDAPPKRAAAVTVMRPQTVIDETGGLGPPPQDLGAWFRERPDLTIVSSTPIELGTASGILIEATVKPDASTNRDGAIPVACNAPPARCHYEFSDLPEPPAGVELPRSLMFTRSEHALIVVVTVGGDLIVVTAGAPPRSWDIVRTDLDAFLRSIRFPG
jgi:hypothetical protein